MLPNERLKKGSHEVMLFPGTSWSCAQYWGPGTYSHCCGYPLDWTGGDLYAPCTVVSAGCIDPSTNCELWYSVDPVWVPSEKDPVHIAFQVGHSESMRGAGTTVPQGGYLNSMGTVMGGHSGGCGLHAHIEFVIGQSTGFENGGCAGVISAAGDSAANSIGAFTKQATTCYNLTGSRPYYEVCFMNDTANDTSSSYAAHHQYAKGLTWVVPREQRRLAVNDEEVYNNMRCVYGFFKCLKDIKNLNEIYRSKASEWTDGAIAGMLANMTNESGMNPNRWEGFEVGNTSRGYGLVQWTPATEIITPLKQMRPVDKSLGVDSLWDEAMNYDPTVLGNAECQQIFFEYCQGLQWWAKDSVSWEEWAHSEEYNSASGASLAAMIFQQNYERPLNIDPQRGVDATNIYNQIKDEKWEKEMPAGLLEAEIINPWDLATDVENGQFRVRRDFIPVYWCPYDENRREAITFLFSHYLFVKNGLLPYAKAYVGAGGFEADNLEKSLVTTWFAWADPNNKTGHWFAPSTNTITESQDIFLEPLFTTNNELVIDSRFSDICFNDVEVEDPYNEKLLFTSKTLPVLYDLVQTGSYDEKAAQKRDLTIGQRVCVWGSDKSAIETLESFNKYAKTAHFFVDSYNIYQGLSLERKSCNMGIYFDSTIDIYLTNILDNKDIDKACTLIAELYYQGFIHETVDNFMVINVATNIPFNANNFKSKVKEKLLQFQQWDFNKLQSKVLTKIKSQQKYDTYLNRLKYLLGEE